ncbi:thiamine pyrophosphate-dependent enzyme [Candidatus Riflebacteria bacterium]
MLGLKVMRFPEIPEIYHSLSDYEGGMARWCPGCGSHAILAAVQRLCREKQLAPEKTVFVSGIGCSSRFPHYMKTFGFHGLHGRAFPVACGIKFRRPDLKVFVNTGDGDCCSIGTAHWIHAIRYNVDMTVMLMDNEIYGLTKKQTSPTSQKGTVSNTNPKGSFLPPINPLATTLGVANCSFVAQTADWVPAHVFATLVAANEHKGFSFVRILQRCNVFNPNRFCPAAGDPSLTVLLKNEKGIPLEKGVLKRYKDTIEHDPADLNHARELTNIKDRFPIGLFYQNKSNPCYDEFGSHNIGFTPEEKMVALNRELDKYAV